MEFGATGDFEIGTKHVVATCALVLCAVPVRGVLHVDAGCANALLNKTNLYAAGITELDGTFEPMDAVAVLCNGAPVARALVNHRSEVRACELRLKLNAALGVHASLLHSA